LSLLDPLKCFALLKILLEGGFLVSLSISGKSIPLALLEALPRREFRIGRFYGM
jgi:hypothetical protein